MQITLIRHAKVIIDNSKKLKASQMKDWIDKYNHSPIDNTLPSIDIIELIKNADLVLASSFSRTKDSLNTIGIIPEEVNPLFNEADIPNSNVKLLKFRPKTWLVILRLIMIFGIGKKAKSLKDSKLRAKEAYLYLEKLSKNNENIALMGHGGMNWLIGNELKNNGWKEKYCYGGSSNWGYKVYYKSSSNEM